MEPVSFTSAEGLNAWLVVHGVPTAVYGQGDAKSVDDLFEEVVKGESVLGLVGATPTRLVTSLNLVLVDGRGRVLREASQRLPDGRVRRRGLPVSEKLLPGEGWREGAARAVAEELGSALPPGWRDQLELLEGSHTESASERTQSPSYPGLRTRYAVHRVRGRLPCLPAGPFETEEPRPPAGVLVTAWEWVAEEALGARPDG